jgi:hypothetical protein
LGSGREPAQLEPAAVQQVRELAPEPEQQALVPGQALPVRGPELLVPGQPVREPEPRAPEQREREQERREPVPAREPQQGRELGARRAPG